MSDNISALNPNTDTRSAQVDVPFTGFIPLFIIQLGFQQLAKTQLVFHFVCCSEYNRDTAGRLMSFLSV